ncbi:hypothetical protein BDV10DRAFT_96606 [Aspergillus recurvatus]
MHAVAGCDRESSRACLSLSRTRDPYQLAESPTVGPASLEDSKACRTIVTPHYVHAHTPNAALCLLQAFMQLSLHNADRLHFAAMLPKRGPLFHSRPTGLETWPNETICRLGSSSMTSPVSSPNLENSKQLDPERTAIRRLALVFNRDLRIDGIPAALPCHSIQ